MHIRTAKEYRLLNLEQITEAEYNLLITAGMLYEYFPEATGSYDNDMKRIDKIGQNGNDGEHYDTTVITTDSDTAFTISGRADNYRVSGDDNPDGVNIDLGWPHRHEDGYAEKIEKLYEPPKDGMFEDDYVPEDRVHKPSHYELGNTGVEAIDVIEAVLTKEQYIGYLRGNIMKYQLRANKKNNEEDLRKADIYSGWLVEALEE